MVFGARLLFMGQTSERRVVCAPREVALSEVIFVVFLVSKVQVLSSQRGSSTCTVSDLKAKKGGLQCQRGNASTVM